MGESSKKCLLVTSMEKTLEIIAILYLKTLEFIIRDFKMHPHELVIAGFWIIHSPNPPGGFQSRMSSLVWKGWLNGATVPRQQNDLNMFKVTL